MPNSLAILEERSDLLVRAKAGDRAAFDRLLAPHLSALYAYSRAICPDHHAAQDVVQETAMIAFCNLRQLLPEADLFLWLRAVARRKALEARRKLLGRRLLPEAVIERVYKDPANESARDRRQALSECLKSLAGRMAEIVDGHYFRGWPLGEIAASLNTTATAVKQMLYRSRLILEKCVSERLRPEEKP